MEKRIDKVSVNPRPSGPISGMHVRFVPFMGRTMIEVVINRNYSLEHPVVTMRCFTPMELLDMEGLAAILWNAGQEIQAIAHEWAEDDDEA